MSKKLPKDLNALGESLEFVFNFRWIELHCHSEAYTLRLAIRQSTSMDHLACRGGVVRKPGKRSELLLTPRVLKDLHVNVPRQP